MKYVGPTTDPLSPATQSQITTQQAALALKLPINATFSDSGTSGTAFMSSITGTASPSASSTEVLFAHKVEMDFNSANNVATGGYVGALQVVTTTQGTGTHDKLVSLMNQGSFVGGHIKAAVLYEAVLSAIGASTIVDGGAMFYVANMAGVPNIGNVAQLAAFQNDHLAAFINNQGRYLKGVDRVSAAVNREMAPARSPGYITGRLYGASCVNGSQEVTLQAGGLYIMPFDCKERTTWSTMQVRRGATAVAAGATLRMGIYLMDGGKLGAQIYGSAALAAVNANIDVQATGIATTLEAGTYALVVTPSVNMGIIFTTGLELRGFFGRSNSTTEDAFGYLAFTYAALPASFASNTMLWNASGANLVPDIALIK